VKTKVVTFAAWLGCFFVSGLIALTDVQGQSHLTVRVMAANTTSGNFSSYQDPGIRIFQGLKPDIVAIQEFRYNASAADAQLRQLVDTAFGPEFHYYREPYTDGGDIPNGIVSRWPIVASGSWDDSEAPNRGYAWAQIDLPGITNDLYVVSVHLLTANASTRNIEAAELKGLIQANFPANAWIIVAGDMNTDSRGEAALTTFKTFLSDNPKPHDGTIDEKEGTNASREKPYDYVLPSFSLTNYLTPMVVGSRTFPKGLVFDSRVYSPLSDVTPVQSGDSGVSGMQHMAVIKDFNLPVGLALTNPPTILTQPQSQTNSIGSLVEFTVAASGTAPLAYQWRFNTANLSGANTSSFTITNAQSTNAGNYTVVITNVAGSVTSAIATLTISSDLAINSQPQNLSVAIGENASFSVSASGAAPLHYQWRFNSVAINSATNSTYTRTNAQLGDAGNYTVVITNATGSVTSSVATLVVNSGTTEVIAQWNFNSNPADADTATGSSIPSTGSGSASALGGITASFVGGDTIADPAGNTDNTAWTTTGYPASGSGNKSAGVRFNVSTAGKQNIVISWTVRASNTGSKYGRLQYSTNGVNFTDFLQPFTNTTTFAAITNNLGAIPAINDSANFAFRLVTEFESTAIGTANAAYVAANSGSSYGTGGTVRFDMVTVRGSDLTINNPPASAPTLTNAFWLGTEFQFLLTGTTGSNYVVQSTTNLNAPTWIPLRTNAAPFIYVETNLPATQRFYRGMVAP
jgi:endonuclease/exonuclease/phosphatase family metal-dependent hydrolase